MATVEEQRAYNRASYHKHKEKRKDKVRLNQQKVRMEVISHYANSSLKCNCCGEIEPRFLCLDHINGGGAKHKREINIKGLMYYYWLRKNNYPSGFQVLCHNCNQAKGFNGLCPHKELLHD